MILVIGDSIIDTYIEGTSERLAPEAPVPVILNPVKTTRFGGANNVYENLLALTPNAEFICDSTNVSHKTRIVANGHIVARLDDEKYAPFEPKVDYSDYEYVVLSDYNKGACHYSYEIINDAIKADCKVFVDPKKSFELYRNAYLLKANKAEIEEELDQEFTGSLNQCDDICSRFNFQVLVVTMGADGLVVYDRKNVICRHIKSQRHNVVDVTGAGDVVMAALVHFIAKGYSPVEAAEFANELAGISVTKFGTYVLTDEDIKTVMGDSVVFTNGCFDVLHRGHIELLRESKKLGNKLIVGINSDESLKRLKGPLRPFNKAEDRKAMLEALEFVDEVIIFDEDTPYQLISQLKPDIITKGGDYTTDRVVGNTLAKVVIIPLVGGHSTTRILNEA